MNELAAALSATSLPRTSLSSWDREDPAQTCWLADESQSNEKGVHSGIMSDFCMSFKSTLVVVPHLIANCRRIMVVLGIQQLTQRNFGMVIGKYHDRREHTGCTITAPAGRASRCSICWQPPKDQCIFPGQRNSNPISCREEPEASQADKEQMQKVHACSQQPAQRHLQLVIGKYHTTRALRAASPQHILDEQAGGPCASNLPRTSGTFRGKESPAQTVANGSQHRPAKAMKRQSRMYMLAARSRPVGTFRESLTGTTTSQRILGCIITPSAGCANSCFICHSPSDLCTFQGRKDPAKALAD